MLRRRLSVVLEMVRRRDEFKELLFQAVLSRSLFILQEVYGTPLEYGYYLGVMGVYSGVLEGDIEKAIYRHDVLDKRRFMGPEGNYRREYIHTKESDWVLKKEKKFLQTQKHAIDTFITHFAGRTLDELDLSATIIYYNCDDAYGRHPNALDKIARKVNETRPTFSLEVIFAECTRLKRLGILERPMEQLACVS